MIRRPHADDLAGNHAIEAVDELIEDVTVPVAKSARGIGRMIHWTYLVPLALVPAMPLLHARWPEVMGTFAAHLGLIGVWAVGAWKFWLAPLYTAKARARIAGRAELGDISEARAELEAAWARTGQ